MKRLLTIVLLLLPAMLAAQRQHYTVSGRVSNGVSGEPCVWIGLKDSRYNEVASVRTDRDGRFALHDVAKGTYNFYYLEDFSVECIKLHVHSDITLDTLHGEVMEKSHQIWYLQKTDPQPASDTYLRQYLAFRRAIDSLPLVFINVRSDTNFSAINYYNVDSIPNAMSVLAALRGITIEKGHLLDVYYQGNYFGGEVRFYTRSEDEPKIPVNGELDQPFNNVPPHIQVEFTAEGIWSAFQLANACCYLPKFWHGYYGDYCGVFTLDEVRRRSPALSDSLASAPEIHNRVELLDADHATVTAYWWNDWQGLIEETAFVERTGRTVRFIFPDREKPDPRATRRTIVPYDCGIMF